MASAKFLEEALSTDVDESAVSAIVGSLENQLVTSTPAASGQQSAAAPAIQQNHVNNNNGGGGGGGGGGGAAAAIANGGTSAAAQKHGAVGAAVANGESVVVNATAEKLVVANNSALPATIIAGAAAAAPGPPPAHAGVTTGGYIVQAGADAAKTAPEQHQQGVKIVYSSNQGGQAMTSTGTIISNRLTFPAQTLPNGTIGLTPITPQTVLQQQPQPTHQTVAGATQQPPKQQPTLVIKTSVAATPGAPTGLVTVPMNVTAAMPQVNNQLTLQSLHGLQPGQQGHLLLKTENGQYQLLRVGPAPAAPAGLTASTTPGASAPVTFRMQTVPTATTTVTASSQAAAVGVSTVATAAAPTVQTVTPVQRPANDNTKEKCRKFLANLLELSSREPKSVERNVRTLIQELIDMRVEPEDFCDRLERLLNASPQPCLIGFLKKSLPLLRHSLATKELTIDGIRPPPANVVFASAAPTVQTQVRPGVATSQVRLVAPGTVVRPGQVLQQRLVTPIRGTVQQTARMVTTIRQPNATNQVIVSSSQPPALHPVFPNNQVRAGIVRQPVQVRNVTPGQVRPPIAVRTTAPVQMKQPATTAAKATGAKPTVPSAVSKVATKEKEKKSFSSAYTGDDDINDVAAMGGVNLAEETQRILGSTEFVGTQIRSCKEEFLLSMGPLQQRIRQVMAKQGFDEPNNDVAALISHAAQERLKNLVEKLAIITEHRLEMVKSDQRYEIISDPKGQLKFLEDMDRAERKKHEEIEREVLLRAAKSRSKSEDPEQAKLKAKAKEMQRVEIEELRQREANATALQAIGPRKKPRLDNDALAGTSHTNVGSLNSGARGQLPLRQRMKKVSLRDLQFLFETEKDLRKSELLYKSYLK